MTSFNSVIVVSTGSIYITPTVKTGENLAGLLV